jgi:hypothetical protein
VRRKAVTSVGHKEIAAPAGKEPTRRTIASTLDAATDGPSGRIRASAIAATELAHGRGKIGDLEHEAIPAARLRFRAVRHRLTAASGATRGAQRKTKIASGQHRERRGWMHQLLETEMPAI